MYSKKLICYIVSLLIVLYSKIWKRLSKPARADVPIRFCHNVLPNAKRGKNVEGNYMIGCENSGSERSEKGIFRATKPWSKIPFLGLSLLSNSSEMLATQATRRANHILTFIGTYEPLSVYFLGNTFLLYWMYLHWNYKLFCSFFMYSFSFFFYNSMPIDLLGICYIQCNQIQQYTACSEPI